MEKLNGRYPVHAREKKYFYFMAFVGLLIYGALFFGLFAAKNKALFGVYLGYAGFFLLLRSGTTATKFH